MKNSEKSINGKRIFIVYTNVGNLSDTEILPYMGKAKLAFKEIEKFDDAIVIYIPIRGENSRWKPFFAKIKYYEKR